MSFTACGFKICIMCIEIIDFSVFKRLMQKTYLFSPQIGVLQANALNSIGYTDTVLFLKLAADSPNLFANISGDCTFTVLPIVGKSTVSEYPTDLIAFESGIPICKGNG